MGSSDSRVASASLVTDESALDYTATHIRKQNIPQESVHPHGEADRTCARLADPGGAGPGAHPPVICVIEE